MQQFRLVKGNPKKLKGSVIAYSKYIGKYQSSDLELAALEPIQGKFSLDIKEGAVFAKWGSINEQEFANALANNKQIMLQNSFYEITKELQLYYAALGAKTKAPKRSIITTWEVKKEATLFHYVEDVIFTGFYSTPALCNSILDVGIAYYLAQCGEARFEIEKKQKKIEEPFHEVFNGKDLEDYINYGYVQPMKEHLENNEIQEYKKLKYDFIWSTIDSNLKNCPTFIQLCDILEYNRGEIQGKLQTHFVKEMAAVLEERFKDAKQYHEQRKLMF